MVPHMRSLLGQGLVLVIAVVSTLTETVPSATAADATTQSSKQPLLLANMWDPSVNPTGWWISEKYDGIRAHWNGKALLTRGGNKVHAPDYFLAELPEGINLDGELWMGRGKFEETMSTVRRNTPDDRWHQVQFMVFDAPKVIGDFELRMDFLRRTLPRNAKHLKRVPHTRCTGTEHLIARRDRVVAAGGEGLMIRKPDSEYEPGQSPTLLKVKPQNDADATVISHKPGKGRFEGMMGSILVRTEEGREFSIGTGFKNADRKSPPPVGATITFRYRGFTRTGLPKFPSYQGTLIE
ncbi:MAG: DNA ligase [Verrucomicrobiia bacterium]|jgi:DNA ligase-1